jgi:biotin operon repressor
MLVSRQKIKLYEYIKEKSHLSGSMIGEEIGISSVMVMTDG